MMTIMHFTGRYPISFDILISYIINEAHYHGFVSKQLDDIIPKYSMVEIMPRDIIVISKLPHGEDKTVYIRTPLHTRVSPLQTRRQFLPNLRLLYLQLSSDNAIMAD